MKALPALLIALLVGVALAISQRSVGPSRAELAKTLSHADGNRVLAADIRSLRCDERQSGGYACSWQQREEDAWVDRTGSAQVDGRGWQLIGVVTGSNER